MGKQLGGMHQLLDLCKIPELTSQVSTTLPDPRAAVRPPPPPPAAGQAGAPQGSSSTLTPSMALEGARPHQCRGPGKGCPFISKGLVKPRLQQIA